MATLGLSKLDAVNQILEAGGLSRVAALDSSGASGTSEQADAEFFLDRENTRIQTLGWPENTNLAKKYTPAGAGALSGSAAIAGDGAWTAATRTLTKASAFPAKVGDGIAGDEIYIVSGTGVKEGYYDITTHTDENSIILDHQAAISDQTNVTAAIYGNLNIQFGSDTLAIYPVGPNSHRNLSLKGDLLYDQDNQTSRLDNDDDLYFDVVYELDYVDCSPKLKDVIATWSAMIFQRHVLKDVTQDAFLVGEYNRINQSADRIATGRIPSRSRNVEPTDFPSLLDSRSPNAT